MNETLDDILNSIKPYILELPAGSEKQCCNSWMKALSKAKDSETNRKDEILHAKLLLHMLKCENLELPFTADPEPDLSKSLPKYICLLLNKSDVSQTSADQGHETLHNELKTANTSPNQVDETNVQTQKNDSEDTEKQVYDTDSDSLSSSEYISTSKNKTRKSLQKEYNAKLEKFKADFENEKQEWKKLHMQKVQERLRNFAKRITNIRTRYSTELEKLKNEINNLEIYTKQMQGDNLESTTPTTTNQSNEENSKSDPRDKELKDGDRQKPLSESNKDGLKNLDVPNFRHKVPTDRISYVRQTSVKWDIVNRALKSCPDGIRIESSQARTGYLGAWAEKDFSVNTIFGRYDGIVVQKEADNVKLIVDGGYAWEVFKSNKLSHYIDASDVRKSNWLRYVNLGRDDTYNIKTYQYKNQVYYQANKEINKGTELLFWFDAFFPGKRPAITVEKTEDITVNKKFADSHRQCTRCGIMFIDEDAVLRHIKSKHPDRTTLKPHKCKFCPYSTHHKNYLLFHIRKHTNEKPFNCSLCPKKFSRKDYLKLHTVRIHTKKHSFACDKCSRSYTTMISLRYHILSTHENPRPYVCSLCGVTLTTAEKLRRHVKNHDKKPINKERNFICQYCEKTFTHSSSLKSHERIHIGDQPYKSKMCPSGNTRVTRLSASKSKKLNDLIQEN